MRIDGRPNRRACMVPARAGLACERQNAFPSADVDLLAAADWLFPRGMDHHTLMTGSRAGNAMFLKMVREMGGSGTLPADAAPRHARPTRRGGRRLRRRRRARRAWAPRARSPAPPRARASRSTTSRTRRAARCTPSRAAARARATLADAGPRRRRPPDVERDRDRLLSRGRGRRAAARACWRSRPTRVWCASAPGARSTRRAPTIRTCRSRTTIARA